jgi:ferredoxin
MRAAGCRIAAAAALRYAGTTTGAIARRLSSRRRSRERMRFLTLLLLLLLPLATSESATADPGLDRRLRTAHFDFYFRKADEPAVREIARFAEGFLDVVRRDFFEPTFDYPIKVLVLPTREAFQTYLRNDLKIADPPAFGIYLGQAKAFVTFVSSGLGTFGLCRGLITPKGKAMRVGSVVAEIPVAPTPRQYTDYRQWCLFYMDGSCRECAKRCPVGAITDEGTDKLKCREHSIEKSNEFIKSRYGFEGYACGLCQTGVPCESRIPRKLNKSG